MKTLIFYDETLPFSGERPDAKDIKALESIGELSGLSTWAQKIASLSSKDTILYAQSTVVEPRIWPSILAHLRAGGGFVVVGNEPLSKVADGDLLYPQSAYFRDLHIHEILEVDAKLAKKSVVFERYNSLGFDISGIQANLDCSGLVLMPTKANDQPGQLGSSGPMDTMVYPLVQSLDKDGIPIASPLVVFEHMRGQFQGGKWIFFGQKISAGFFAQHAKLLGQLSTWAGIGVTECRLEPVHACVKTGERASLKLKFDAIKDNSEWQIILKVLDEQDGKIWTDDLTLQAVRGGSRHYFHVNKDLKPGYYRVELQAKASSGDAIDLVQGFWQEDQALLSSKSRLKVIDDYFERDGKLIPIIGMTYMAPFVHRKYLELPNAAHWNADFAHFKKIGITYVRSGIWNAWRQYMFIDGEFRDAALRAIDAMVHTAHKYEIELCFNFFAFTPELWEGVNPYLDPRSIEAQKRFISEIVSRYKNANGVHFDLINEPSTFDPSRLFAGPRTLRDPFEIKAFQEFLKAKNPEIAYWRARWDKTPLSLPDFESITTPQPDDIGFGTTEGRVKEHGLWLDYTLFTQNAYSEWAKTMSDHIKSYIPTTLVTTGQDEGMEVQRPHNQFFGRVMDYTNIHTWWLNDALSWDAVVTKIGRKPNVIQETGIMHVESPNGRSKRTEQELSTMLERKYAYSFVSGGAGAVQWIWNINYHMDNNNESHIGALRADASHKPEAFVVRDFGKFFAAFAPEMRKRKLEEIALLLPFSNDFGPRKTAGLATSSLVRTLHYSLKVAVRALSEYHTDDLKINAPKLLIVPSPQVLISKARKDLISYVKAGGTLLISGPLNLDEYWNEVPAELNLFAQSSHKNQLREERLELDRKSVRVSMHYDTTIRCFKGVDSNGESHKLHVKALEKGQIIWSPLSIELSSREKVRVEVYEKAMELAKISRDFKTATDLQGIFIEKQHFEKASLWILVSEDGRDRHIDVQDTDTGVNYSLVVPAERAVLFATDASGRIITSLRNHEVHANAKE